MMRRMYRVFALLLLASIPLQGVSAVLMPLCKASMLPQSPAAEHNRQQTDHAQHVHHTPGTADHGQHGGGKHDSKNLGCDNCAPCHLACSPVLHVVTADLVLPAGDTFQSPRQTSYYLLAPEQLLHPPRLF
jgi:hypothetical protein